MLCGVSQTLSSGAVLRPGGPCLAVGKWRGVSLEQDPETRAAPCSKKLRVESIEKGESN